MQGSGMEVRLYPCASHGTAGLAPRLLLGSALGDLQSLGHRGCSAEKECGCQREDKLSGWRQPASAYQHVRSWMGGSTNSVALAGLELGLWNFLASSAQVERKMNTSDLLLYTQRCTQMPFLVLSYARLSGEPAKAGV